MNTQRKISNDEATPRPRGRFDWMDLLGVALFVAGTIYLLRPPLVHSPEAGRRSHCKYNLKQIGLALHYYHDKYEEFPPAYTVDEHGKPLHSWRTLILPFIDQQKLYESIDLSKPWNDPVNAEAFKAVVSVYQCPSVKSEPGMTTYLSIIGDNTCLRPARSLSMREITDGTSNTLAVVEVPAKHTVHWMAPQDADLALLLGLPTEKDEMQHSPGYYVLFCDGATRFLNIDLPESTVRALVSANANDELGEF